MRAFSVKLSTTSRVAAVVGLAALAGVAMTTVPAQAKCVGADDIAGIELPAGCLSADDGMIVRMRLFRADLAVAALFCDKQAQYNALVTRHRDELVRGGRSLKTLFKRLYKVGATRELNRFVTHLTNRASLRSLAAHGYCRAMGRVFDKALAVAPDGLMNFVRARPVKSEITLLTVARKGWVPAPANTSTQGFRGFRCVS